MTAASTGGSDGRQWVAAAAMNGSNGGQLWAMVIAKPTVTALMAVATVVMAAAARAGMVLLNGDVHFVCCVYVASHLKIIK